MFWKTWRLESWDFYQLEIRIEIKDYEIIHVRVQKNGKGSSYEEWVLIEEFKRKLNGAIKCKLIETE